jgi:uncharacterized protein (DUF2141 family)
MSLNLLSIIWAFVWGNMVPQTPQATITINVAGVENNNGLIVVSLYKTGEGFPTDMSKATLAKKIPASTKGVQATFNVPPGIYAVSVLHDENKNGDMDKNWLGMPSEGYCASNNAKSMMSPPSFTDAKFVLRTEFVQTIKMIY